MSENQAEIPMIATDARGRKLSIQKLDLLNEMDLIETAGDASGNSRWMTVATLAATVRSIDGVPVIYPTDRKQLRNLLKIVGSDGLAAVIETLKPDLPDDVEVVAPDQTAVASN